MALRLTTDDSAIEMSSLEVKLAAACIADTVRGQLQTFPSVAIAEMRKAMGAEMFERLIRDIANNVVQSLV